MFENLPNVLLAWGIIGGAIVFVAIVLITIGGAQ